MPRVAGVDIPNDKHTVISLRYIYGIGPKFATEICEKLRLDPNLPAKNLTEEDQHVLNDQVKQIVEKNAFTHDQLINLIHQVIDPALQTKKKPNLES